MRRKINKEEMQIKNRILILKSRLHRTDYKAIKYAEGELSEAENAETRTQRRQWRAEINELEAKLTAIQIQEGGES